MQCHQMNLSVHRTFIGVQDFTFSVCIVASSLLLLYSELCAAIYPLSYVQNFIQNTVIQLLYIIIEII